MMRLVLFFPLAVLSIVGCTHTQLKINMIATSRTWSDIQYQQVADNLAMLAYNSEMLPYFIVLGQGSVEIVDTVALGGALEWEPSARATRMLGLDLGREATANWELRPITVPIRLDWMRTIYLCALGSKGHDSWKNNPCKTFLEEFEGWYDFPYDEKDGKFGPFKSEACSVQIPPDAIVVGRYRDTVVIVLRDQMRDLRLLTTLILEYATLKYEEDAPEEEGEGKKEVKKYQQKRMRPSENFYNQNLRGN